MTTNTNPAPNEKVILLRSIEIAIRIGLIGPLVFWSILIFEPFRRPVVFRLARDGVWLVEAVERRDDRLRGRVQHPRVFLRGLQRRFHVARLALDLGHGTQGQD